MDPKSPSSDHHWGLSWWVPQDNNKHKAVLNQAQEGYPLSPRLHSLAQHKGTEDKKAHPQVCSWEWLNFIVSQLLPESLASNQPLSRCYDPFLHWLTARHTASLTGSHKEQRQQLRQPQRLRDNHKFGFGLFIYMTSFHQDWERRTQWAETNAGDLRKCRTSDRPQVKEH